ncbi:MAG: hypothetical protein AB1746_03695 [Candidatus Zixiibacteriota bacterium]
MFKKSLHAAAGAIIILSLVIAGCSSDEKQKPTSVVKQVVGEITDSVINQMVDAQFAQAPVKHDKYTGSRFSAISDLIVVDSVVYAVFDKGLIVYSLADSTYRAIDAGEKLNAVAMHGDQIFVGGDNLYLFRNGALETVRHHFDKPIRALQSYKGKLMIGTDQGLYSKADNDIRLVREDIPVTAMTADEDGLWVGTFGKGLFRMDGDEFKKRYLIRDTSIFDYVNCLDYSRGFVYAGTNDAMYIFDGGSWDTWTTENGLPSNVIRDIDASGWVVYIATDNGVIGMFDNNLYPARTLEHRIVNVVQKFEGKVIAGTDSDGLLLKSGSFLKTLIEPGFIAEEIQGPPETEEVQAFDEAAEPEEIAEDADIQLIEEAPVVEEPAEITEDVIEENADESTDESVEVETKPETITLSGE